MTNHPRRLGRRKHQLQAGRMVHGYPHSKHRPDTCTTCRWIHPNLFPFEQRQAVDIASLVREVKIGHQAINPRQLLVGPAL